MDYGMQDYIYIYIYISCICIQLQDTSGDNARNNIFIAPFAESSTKWYLDITINGKRNRSPDVHTKTTLWNQMFKYYIYYYEKYKKDE